MLVVGTAGHIDHGKSALVRALTGTDPDRLKEEKARGITIDLGFAHLTLGDLQVAFVDVPGHERFVRNMLAGAGGIDAVLLVVAADESVMPQTREHFEICRLLGISRGLVVLTKADLVDADTLGIAELDVRELVRGSFLAHAPVLPVSSKTGAGLGPLRTALQVLGAAPPSPARPGVVRLPVDRVFSVRGFGTVVTGTLVSGTVAEGDELAVLPELRRVRVRGLQVHGRPASHVTAPSRAALNLGSIETADLARGVTLATPGAMPVTRRVDVRLRLIVDVKPLLHGARVRVHHGTGEISARVALAAIRQAGAGEAWTPMKAGERGGAVPAGGEAYARLRLERPAVLTRGDRLVLRTFSPPQTIGGAVVLDPEPPGSGVRRPAVLARFQGMDPEASGDAFARTWIQEAGARGLAAADLIRRGGQDPAAANALLETLRAESKAVSIGERLVDADVVEALETGVQKALERFHEARPRERGIPRESLREAVARRAPPEVFDAVVKSLLARQIVVGRDRLALRSCEAALDSETEGTRASVETILLDAGLMPPDAAGLQAALRLAPDALAPIVHVLVRDQRVVRVGSLLFHAEALARLREDLQAIKARTASAAPAEIDVATFKARYGLSRKFAIPLLEWLDQQRVTRRVGDRRVLL